jgi:hypothetical protein
MTLNPPTLTSYGKEVFYDGAHFADAATEFGAEQIAAAVTAHLSAEPMPLLTFAEAEAVGQKLHAHWTKMAPDLPLTADDMAFADLVQLVAREARAIVRERREKADG